MIRPNPPTDEFDIVAVDHPSDEFDDIVRVLYRSDKKYLGFLPDGGFSDRCEKGTLLAAVSHGKVLGYALYDLPGNIVKLVHLCVHKSHRSQGVARRLLDEVCERHQSRIGVQADCRRDYPANSAWPELGFVARGERIGRSKAGHLLTIWFRDHGHPTLFTYTPEDAESLPAVALDHNVVIDLLTNRAEGAQSRHLLDDWVAESVVLCNTSESYQEVNRLEDAAQRAKMRDGLEQFRTLDLSIDPASRPFEDLASEVRSKCPDVGESDHQHVTRAILGNADFFVTRDGPLLKHRRLISDDYGMALVRPEELILELDRSRSDDRYMPRTLNATPLELTFGDITEQELVTSFLNHGSGEKAHQLLEALRTALAEPTTYEVVVVRSNKAPVGLVIRRWSERLLEVSALRVASSSSRFSHAIARQLCFLQRQDAATRNLDAVRVTDRLVQPPGQEGLRAEGYGRVNRGWQCEIKYGFEKRLVGASIQESALVERHKWPLKVLGSGLPTFVVPIRPAFALELFDSTLAASTLFGRIQTLGLSREHVYYRKPANSNGIGPPARILWYVSGQTEGQKEGHIRAVSQLVEVAIDRPLTVFRRFQRLGVYDERQVIHSADTKGRVMALRFHDTELLSNPVGFAQLQRIGAESGDPYFATPSPRRVTDSFFEALYREASAHGR